MRCGPVGRLVSEAFRPAKRAGRALSNGNRDHLTVFSHSMRNATIIAPLDSRLAMPIETTWYSPSGCHLCRPDREKVAVALPTARFARQRVLDIAAIPPEKPGMLSRTTSPPAVPSERRQSPIGPCSGTSQHLLVTIRCR